METDKTELKARMETDKTELKARMETDKTELKAAVGSVKTWFVGLALSTILVVTAIMTTFLNILSMR